MKYTDIPSGIMKEVRKGMVIPALPLALNQQRQLDERRQRALLRYYLDAGAGGIAVGVHTTQFEIRDPEHNLFKPVLQIAREEFDRFAKAGGREPFRVAGVVGKTSQAVQEAETLKSLGYHAALLGVAAFKTASNDEIIAHCEKVAEIMPVIGFYLQPAVGGRKLDVHFWRRFAAIPNVMAIKMAPFNRYQTFDVVRGVAESGRSSEISLYTGNDDNILVDLLSKYEVDVNGKKIKLPIVGGLLGHWAVWTQKAVQLLQMVQAGSFEHETSEALTLAHQITDANAAFFDADNDFSGVIAGIHEVLRRQGLLEGVWLLNENEQLSPGQKVEIDRVYKAYPHLNDDDFIRTHIDKWMAD